MSARDISKPFNPSAHQTIHIFVYTKLCFQETLRRLFGESRLKVINALVHHSSHRGFRIRFPWMCLFLCCPRGVERETKFQHFTMLAFPNFYGRKHKNASYFLDDLEMALLASRQDEDEVKIKAFPLVLKDEAKI